MNLPDDNRTTKSSPTVHDTENTVISTGPKTSKNSTVSPQGRSFADFDALPVSPLGGYKTYEKSYVNMPGYHSAKEKVDGGGIQPQLVPAYGIPPPFYGQPNGGYRGPLVDNSIPTGVLPPYSAVGPAASSGTGWLSVKMQLPQGGYSLALTRGPAQVGQKYFSATKGH